MGRKKGGVPTFDSRFEIRFLDDPTLSYSFFLFCVSIGLCPATALACCCYLCVFGHCEGGRAMGGKTKRELVLHEAIQMAHFSNAHRHTWHFDLGRQTWAADTKVPSCH